MDPSAGFEHQLDGCEPELGKPRQTSCPECPRKQLLPGRACAGDQQASTQAFLATVAAQETCLPEADSQSRRVHPDFTLSH